MLLLKRNQRSQLKASSLLLLVTLLLTSSGLVASDLLPEAPKFEGPLSMDNFPKSGDAPENAFYDSGNYGLGFIGTLPFPAKSEQYYNLMDFWGAGFNFPVFSHADDNDFLAWVVDGRYVQGETVSAFEITSLPEVGYEVNAFTVLEMQADTGWMKLQFKLQNENPWRNVWTNSRYLKQSKTPLGFMSWGELLKRESIFFRTPKKEGYSLKSTPNKDSSTLALIKGDSDAYTINVQEIKADWMKIHYYIPACGTCLETICDTKNMITGWVRWRQEGIGPRLWFHSRGC